MSWKIRVDWEGNYDYAGESDDITTDVIEASWRLGMHKPFQNAADEAACTVKVRNTDGKYSPEMAGGVLLKPNRRLQIAVVRDSVETVMYQGWLKEVSLEWSPGPQAGQTFALLHCVGFKEQLDRQEIRMALMKDKRADEIIARVLLGAPVLPINGAAWVLGDPNYSILGDTTLLNALSHYADLEAGVGTFRYYGDANTYRDIDRAAEGDKKQSGYRIIREVVEAERGRFFQDRVGRAVFWNRYHLPLVTEAAGTVSSDGAIKPVRVQYVYGATFCNSVEVIPFQRAEGSTRTLWRLDSPITVKAGEKIQFEALFLDDDGGRVGAAWATLGTTQSVGGKLTFGIRPYGDRAVVTAANQADTQSAVITELTVEGPVLTSNNRLIAYAENRDSIHTYQKTPTLRLHLPVLEDYETAERIARHEVRRRSIPRGEALSITFLDRSAAHQIDWEIGTRITVSLPELGHEQDYFIMGEDHRISAGLKVQETTFYLERVEANQLWVLGVGKLGEDTILGI